MKMFILKQFCLTDSEFKKNKIKLIFRKHKITQSNNKKRWCPIAVKSGAGGILAEDFVLFCKIPEEFKILGADFKDCLHNIKIIQNPTSFFF